MHTQSAPQPVALKDICAGVTEEGLRSTVAVSFDAQPPVRLGSGEVTPTVTANHLQETGETGTYEVTDSDDPPGNAGTTAVLSPDTLYMGYIADPGDVDAYRIHAPAAGSVVTVSLSNLPSDDYDLYVQGPKVGSPSRPAAHAHRAPPCWPTRRCPTSRPTSTAPTRRRRPTACRHCR